MRGFEVINSNIAIFNTFSNEMIFDKYVPGLFVVDWILGHGDGCFK